MTKVTIIIPTYNRPNYLRRILDYYNSHKIDYKIIIADSGLDKNKIINQNNISLYPNLDILYLKNYSEEISPLYKIIDTLNYVQTEYCVICADDNFITPIGIKQSVDFLRKNLDFTIVHGHYFIFYSETSGKNFFYWMSAYPLESKSIVFSDAKSRVIEYLINYYPNFYGVYRTDFLKMIFRETSKNTNDVWFGEILPALLSLVYGKMKHLDVLYGAYELIPNSTSIKEKGFIDFMKDGTYDKKYRKFKNCLSLHLSKNSLLKIEKSGQIIDEGISVFLKKHKYNLSNYKHFVINRIRRFLSFLPNSVSKKIRALRLGLRFKFYKSKSDFSKPLDNPSSKYYEDFNKIKNCVMSHKI